MSRQRIFKGIFETWIGRKASSPFPALPSCVILLIAASPLPRLENICRQFERSSWLGGFNTCPSMCATNIFRWDKLVGKLYSLTDPTRQPTARGCHRILKGSWSRIKFDRVGQLERSCDWIANPPCFWPISHHFDPFWFWEKIPAFAGGGVIPPLICVGWYCELLCTFDWLHHVGGVAETYLGRMRSKALGMELS